ncbi:dolichyl-phosphate-mannose-protein mannosyltransferase [Roseiarcus fermentans]|uniref:Dolichyl-phosphate-mannose-protein mannosyltransferase n=1 Tax=Roseiarcus fermentans TaxID=1473586 RepID=A0A366FR18_9HYPH|nr:glycosyltransferase family 39 protein [Roseiarcus fermentans]RBP17134.1 dolichyl-phosphate-mannose-protein mannosyltransferase [Roseiarcus fermentans]
MRGGHWLLDRPELALGLATLALHLWLNGRYGYFRDELYFIVCGRHPAWGYTDQPPLVPLIAAASDAAFGSLRGLRLVPALASAAFVALAATAAAVLGGGRYARWLSGLAALAAGALQLVGVLLTTDTLLPLAWLAIGLCVVKAERDDEPRWFLAAGAVAGVTFLAKYTVALYLASIALALLLSPQRRLLARWQPWAGALLACAVAAPNLVWQARNGWPFVAHTAVLAGKNIPHSPGAFLVQEALTLGPATAPLWIAGFAAFAVWRGFWGLRWVAISSALLVAAAALGNGRPYYIAPAFPLLMAGGAVALEAWLPPLGRAALAAAVLVVGVVSAPLFLPVLPIETLIAYLHAIGFRPSTGERLALADLPQYYADQFGWPEMAEVVGRAYQALPPQDRARAVFFAWNYGDAAAIDVFGAPWGLPPAISGHESYFLWGPRSADGSVVLILGGTRARLTQMFRSVEPVGRFSHPLAMPEESGQTVWLCRDILQPVDQLWPRLRHFG